MKSKLNRAPAKEEEKQKEKHSTLPGSPSLPERQTKPYRHICYQQSRIKNTEEEWKAKK
jgi:hypothetical protein